MTAQTRPRSSDRQATPSNPMEALHERVAAAASGELICAAPSCELHVYLQAGRVAWATDSTHPFAFSRYLLEHTSLTKETFQEVLETCRRDRLPLGETLIEWKVLTIDEIRAALFHQIEAALESLAAATNGRTIFLERHKQFASYDVRLTFDIDEVVEARSTVRLVREPDASIADVLDKIRGSIPPPAWLALVEGEEVLDRRPSGVEDLVPPEVFGHTTLDGSDLVAMRTGRGTVVGVALPEADRTVWCRLEVETALGTTLSGLSQYARPSSLPPANEREQVGAAVRAIGEGSTTALHFMDRAPEVDGVLVIDADGSPLLGGYRPSIDGEWMKAMVRRRAPVLDLMLADVDRRSALEDLGYHLKSLVTGEGDRFCFGAELPGQPKRTVWLFTGRNVQQGLGWAYLTSLSRQLTEAEA